MNFPKGYKNMKKFISFSLSLMLCLLSVTACSEKPEETETVAPVETAADPSATEEETESPTPHWDNVAKTDLDGIEINISQNNYDKNFYNVVDWEEITGERLNDAVYNRNRFIEEQLSCVMNVVSGGTPATILEEAVIAGTGEVDLAYGLMSYGGGLIQKGYLMPFNDLETVDMTQPYWDQGAQDNLKVLDKMYYGYLDFGFDHYDSMTVLFYNGILVDKYQIEDPYDLWKNQEWTIDKMGEMLDIVSNDENGNGKFELENDIYGLAGREYNFQPMLFASNVSLVSWDAKESKFTFNMMDERFLSIAEKISEIYCDDNADHVHYANYDLGRTAFSDGRVLFYSRLLGDFKNLREVEDDYGLMSFPRYDYADEKSYSFVQNPTTLFLPVDIGDDNGDGEDDYNELGVFLEAIGAYTYDAVLVEYTEHAVVGKGMRDQNSVEVFWDMITRRSFDLMQSFTFPNIGTAFYNSVVAGSSFASSAKRLTSAFDKSAKKVVEDIIYNTSGY